jgi:hypothetical protein
MKPRNAEFERVGRMPQIERLIESLEQRASAANHAAEFERPAPGEGMARQRAASVSGK